MNIMKKMKVSKSFETQFFGLKRCLAVSLTYMHSHKTIFREKTSRVASLRLYLSRGIMNNEQDIQGQNNQDQREDTIPNLPNLLAPTNADTSRIYYNE